MPAVSKTKPTKIKTDKPISIKDRILKTYTDFFNDLQKNLQKTNKTLKIDKVLFIEKKYLKIY